MAASVGMRRLLLRSQYLHRRCHLCTRGQTSAASVQEDGRSGPAQSSQVVIPKKIKRSPTAILEAMASTVGHDPTGSHYNFMDDPYLIPLHQGEAKIFNLSLASGRRAARFIIDSYPHIFEHDAAFPPVKAFQSQVKPYVHTVPGEPALLERIQQRKVKDAIEVYKTMKLQEMSLSEELKMSLLELVCVFGGNDPPEKLEPEEKLMSMKPDQHSSDLRVAEELFLELKEKTADAYNWMVQGMLQEGKMDGLLYWEEMQDRQIPAHLNTWNQLLRYHAQSNSVEEDHRDLMKYLVKMKENGVKPNLETFNAFFNLIEMKGDSRFSRDLVRDTLAEMKAIQIEPTLETYTNVLCALMVNTDRNNKALVLKDISAILERLWPSVEQTFYVPGKRNFFLIGAQLCRSTRSTETCLDLYNFKKELGFRYVPTNIAHETEFVNILINVAAKTESLSFVMDLYRELFPSNFQPMFGVVKALLNMMKMFDCFDDLDTLWNDLYNPRFSPELAATFFEFMALPDHSLEKKERYAEYASKVFKDWENMYRDRNNNSSKYFRLKLEYYEAMMNVFISSEDVNMVWKSYTALASIFNELYGDLSRETLEDLLNLLIDARDVQKLMDLCEIHPTISDVSLDEVLEVRKDELESFLLPKDLKNLRNSLG